MRVTQLKQPETALSAFDMNAADHPRVRELLEERDAITARLDDARSNFQNYETRLSLHTSEKPPEEDGILQRARRLLSGDTSAGLGGVGSRVLDDLRRDYRQASTSVEVFEAALRMLNRRIETETMRATVELLQQPDFQQAREGLLNAVQNLLETHAAGLALTERAGRQGYLVREAAGHRSGAHLPKETAEILEVIANGEVPYIPSREIHRVGRIAR
jgi:hypothetical protein